MRSEIARTGTAVQLLQQNLVPGSAAGTRRAGYAAHQHTVADPGQGAGLQAGHADFRQGHLAEQLAEAFHMLVQQRHHRLRRVVPGSETGAAGHQHYLHLGVGDPV
ncbi:hypothetical protein D3C81_1875250 [compost metagenome]